MLNDKLFWNHKCGCILKKTKSAFVEKASKYSDEVIIPVVKWRKFKYCLEHTPKEG